MYKIKVEQLENKNQFIIYNKNKIYFQSYSSLICEINPQRKTPVKLYPDYDYSKTTSKHLYIFLDMYANNVVRKRLYNAKNKRKELAKMIKEGVILYEKNY